MGGHRPGMLSLALHPNNSGAFTARRAYWANDEKVQVQMTTIDSIYHSIPSIMRRVGLMKIDVEGWEGKVLYGCKRLFTEAPPCMIKLEMSDSFLALAGTPRKEVQQFLSAHGYIETARDGGFVNFESYWQQHNMHACMAARNAEIFQRRASMADCNTS